MKILLKALLLIFAGLVFLACKDSIVDPGEYEFIGVWIQKSYESDTLTFERSEKLNNDKPGYIFLSDNKIIERKNSGWCGTPPIAYTNFDGKWELIDESHLKITVGYWGGTTNYKLEVFSCKNNKLIMKRIYNN